MSSTREHAIATAVNGAERLDAIDDRPAIGSWWWVTDPEEGNEIHRYDEPGRRWLAAVIEVGSNYAKLEGVHLHERVALDDFHERCKPENNPDAYVALKVGFHKSRVRELMAKIQAVCHRLGVPTNQALGAGAIESATQALAVTHGVADVKKYGKDLVKLREKTLPELFKQVAAAHAAMATWMAAELIPMKAQLAATREVTEVIQDKIHTVELYAGLHEELVQVREGAPAASDAKVHLMQRRHYMDEECLARYEAGGMRFEDIGAFDKWISRDENFRRIFPHDRTIVAFRVRRYDRRSDETSIEAYIALWHENQDNRRTFLYIRNGDQLWRMETSIDFEEELFPSREDSDLLGDEELWVKPGRIDHDGLITGRRRAMLMQNYRDKRRILAKRLLQWRAAGKPGDDEDDPRWAYTVVEGDESWSFHRPGSVRMMKGRPSRDWDIDRNPADDYVLLTPTNIFYDDAMKRIRRAAFEHNRVAVIVQGLLDRSTCLHPHPPWRIWTAEGFAAGIELVYDVSRVLTPGEAIDFEAYRAQLNKSLRPGCYTIGQYGAWRAHMAKTHGSKWENYISYTNKGPGRIARVERVRRDGSCEFKWMRSRSKPKWVRNPERPGYLKATYPPIATGWICPRDRLTCIDAYTPGDFHLFYDDPRTRGDYLRWAPILLAAEDWHAKRRTGVTDETDDETEDDE